MLLFMSQGMGGIRRRELPPISSEGAVKWYMANFFENVNNVAYDLDIGEEHGNRSG
jgi:hypothetical protein